MSHVKGHMYILGISCFYHEAAACIIRDGRLIAASAEERFSRKKHDSSFPMGAIDFCLKQAKISKKDLDYIVFYEKPFWKFHRVFMSCLATYPLSSRLFAKGMLNFMTEKLWVRSSIAQTLKIDPAKILFVPHHVSHAASAFYPSGFDSAAILTIDGVGEWTTTALSMGERNKIKVLSEIKFPHSIGLLYSTFTAFLGFEVNEGEYKVMGMAPYGVPKFKSKVYKLINKFGDGSYSLNMKYFSYHKSMDKSFAKPFVELFGKPRPQDLNFFTKKSGYPSYFGEKPKNYEELCRLNQHYADIAASIQSVTEELILGLVNNLYDLTGSENLCIAGGVGLNSVANGLLLKKSKFKRIFVQPAAGDDGGALGAALYVHSALFNKKRRYVQKDCYLGEGFSNEQIGKFLKKHRIKFTKFSDEKKLIKYLADQLASEKVIGFFHGRAEWGPRALGARSIIASPRSTAMKEIVNTKIKFREPYRPFAPVTLLEKANDYFELDGLEYQYLTDYMLGVFPVRKKMRKIIPAVTHEDGSGRLQTISKKTNSRYYNLIKKFGEKTGVYVLMNTSFNLKGEPVVNSPEDAFATFRSSGLDILALENFVVEKADLKD